MNLTKNTVLKPYYAAGKNNWMNRLSGLVWLIAHREQSPSSSKSPPWSTAGEGRSSKDCSQAKGQEENKRASKSSQRKALPTTTIHISIPLARALVPSQPHLLMTIAQEFVMAKQSRTPAEMKSSRAAKGATPETTTIATPDSIVAVRSIFCSSVFASTWGNNPSLANTYNNLGCTYVTTGRRYEGASAGRGGGG